MTVFNQKPDLLNFKNDVIQVMHYATSANLATGHYSEGTYLVRYNSFLKNDNWYWSSQSQVSFFDFDEYITQEFVTTPDKIKNGAIAKIFIYISDDSMQHQRSVITVVNFVGSIAGVYELMFSLAVLVFGDYIKFRSYLLWMKSLYKIEIFQSQPDKKDIDRNSEEIKINVKRLNHDAVNNDGSFKISNILPMKLYLEFFCCLSKYWNSKQKVISNEKFLRKNLAS